MKLSVLLIAVVAAAWCSAAGAAGARHQIPHRSFSKMSAQQKQTWLRRQERHDRGAISWLESHLATAERPRSVASVTSPLAGLRTHVPQWRLDLTWFRVSHRIVSRELAAIRAAAPPPTDGSWGEFSCIHGLEGPTDANTGNGYYGGLQMDLVFQQTYGPEFLSRWGTADRWPVWAQVTAARRARDSGRGYSPWPNTARACGQL